MSSQKNITIYDIAKHLNISTGTVCRALRNTGRVSEQTRLRVLETAEKLGYKVNPAAQALGRNPIYIGVILCCPVKQYLDEVVSGVFYEAERLKAFNVIFDNRLIAQCNSEDKQQEILEHLESFRQKGYDGAVLFLSGSNAFAASYLRKYSQEGMRFACVANDIPGVGELITVSADGKAAGSLACELLSLGCRGRNVAVLTGAMHTQIHKDNVEGFLSAAGENTFGNISVYEHGDKEEVIISRIKDMIGEKERVDGIYMTSASSAFAADYIASLDIGYKPMIITTDLFKETRELLERGIATATIYQNPFKQGRKVVNLLYSSICDKKGGRINSLLIPHAVFRSNAKVFGEAETDAFPSEE